MSYKPIYTVTNRIIDRVAEIAELTGRLSEISGLNADPVLRRKNRILSIHGSLAIEQNTLTIEQITAVLSGKRVLAPPKDIEEVKNAFEIYSNIELLAPYSVDDILKAHGVMMRGLTGCAGQYSDKPVEIVDSNTGDIIHFGALPAYVPDLMEQLFNWLKESDLHILIKSCIFHYELEVIHPFLDGNGRIGRLWHTVLLAGWKSIYAMLPVESIIFRNQQEYYNVINLCNNKCDCTDFIEFMLNVIYETVQETIQDNVQDNIQVSLQVSRLLSAMGDNAMSAVELMELLGLKSRQTFRKNYLDPALEQGLIVKTVPDKPNSRNQRYRKVK